MQRRSFIKGMLVAGSAPVVLPGRVWGANAGINIGIVGCGSRGNHLSHQFMHKRGVRVVAACDVDSRALEGMVERVNKHYGDKRCRAFRDFRDLLGESEIDAVVVATPDHWHALIGIAAARAGKHIFCEKPLANSLGESQALRNAVVKAGVVLQTGSGERSRQNARYCCEVVRNGYIGNLHTMRINLPTDEGHHKRVRQQKGMPQPADPPASLDYNFWLGHTPEIPYYPGLHPGQWRFNMSFGQGEMSDRGAHVIDIAQLGNNSDNTGPLSIEARGWDDSNGLYNTPMSFEFENHYANGVKMVGGTTTKPRGVRFEGDEGWIFLRIHEGTLEASDERLLKLNPSEFNLKLGRADNHEQNFIDAISKGIKPFACVEVGHRSCTACLVNMVAMQLKRRLEWDPVAEHFKGDVEANSLLTPAMRAPWSLS